MARFHAPAFVGEFRESKPAPAKLTHPLTPIHCPLFLGNTRATSRCIDAALALDTLNQAIALRSPQAGLIVHSDRGSQFASLDLPESFEPVSVPAKHEPQRQLL